MAYLDSEILNKDMDWFVKINQHYIHAASAGGMIPTVIYENDEKNKSLARAIKHMPSLFKEEEIEINPFLRQILHLEEQQEELSFVLSACNISYENNPIDTYIKRIYCYSFMKFAQKGFLSFDKTNINNFNDSEYHLVARPRVEGNDNIIKLPSSFILNEISINENIRQWQSISLVDIIDRLNSFRKAE